MTCRSAKEQAKDYIEGLADFLHGDDPDRKARFLRSKRAREMRDGYEASIREFARS